MNYTLAENKLIKVWNKWATNIYDIIKNKHREQNNNDDFNIHVIVGLKYAGKFLTKIYPKIKLLKKDEKFDIINNESNIYKKFDLYLKHFEDIKKVYNVDSKLIDILDNAYNDSVIDLVRNNSTSTTGFILSLEQHIKNINNLSKKHNIYYDPLFDKVKNYKNTYILFINNLFGINSYYMSNSINNIFKNKLKSMNSIGSCGGSNKNINLGDFVISNNINCWSNLINAGNNASTNMGTNMGTNIYENISPYTNSLKNIIKYNTYSNNIMKNIENEEALNYLIYDKKLHYGKTCTVSIIPFETDEFLNLLHNNNILSVEMENYWIKKGCPNVKGIYCQYVSDLLGYNDFKFTNKDLHSINLAQSLLRLTLASIIF